MKLAGTLVSVLLVYAFLLASFWEIEPPHLDQTEATPMFSDPVCLIWLVSTTLMLAGVLSASMLPPANGVVG
jgi:hypothetical protein